MALLIQYLSLGSAAGLSEGVHAKNLHRVGGRKILVTLYSFSEQVSIWRILGPGLPVMLEDTGECNRHTLCPFGALLSLVFMLFGVYKNVCVKAETRRNER